MPWLRLSDVGYDDPLVRTVGNAAYGALTRIKQYAAAQRTDGWIDTGKARELASEAELRRLTTSRLGDGPTLLHRPGDDCRCLPAHAWPADRGGYYVHNFLDGNPSRSENDVHRAKRRELRDPALKAEVRERDGDHCRYCGTPVRWRDRKTPFGGVYDHVDPRLAAGADNLVVACRGCNSTKSDCLPAEAGLTLRPLPGSVTDQRRDQRPISDGSATGSVTRHRSDTDHDTDPDTDPHPGPDPNQGTGVSTEPQVNGEIHAGTTAGTGRGRDGPGHATETPRTVGPPTTPRDNLAPSPYAKRATRYRPPEEDRPDA